MSAAAGRNDLDVGIRRKLPLDGVELRLGDLARERIDDEGGAMHSSEHATADRPRAVGLFFRDPDGRQMRRSHANQATTRGIREARGYAGVE